MIKPYSNSTKTKSQEVEHMFNRIAVRYDFINCFLSLNVSSRWQKRLLRMIDMFITNDVGHRELNMSDPCSTVISSGCGVQYKVLDVACGTGALTFELFKDYRISDIVGLDLSEQMLGVATKRKVELSADKVTLVHSCAENMPFETEQFDIVTCAYGVRNYGSLFEGLREMHRVLKERGIVYILEFSTTNNILFNLYFKHILPRLGGWLSGDKQAYRYLQKSAEAFPSGENFVSLLREIGFSDFTQTKLSGGIATIYSARK